jgi:hypothetical protein
LPVARRQRLAVVAGHLAGLAGSLAFRENQLAASPPFPHFGVGNTYTYRISSPLPQSEIVGHVPSALLSLDPPIRECGCCFPDAVRALSADARKE